MVWANSVSRVALAIGERDWSPASICSIEGEGGGDGGGGGGEALGGAAALLGAGGGAGGGDGGGGGASGGDGGAGDGGGDGGAADPDWLEKLSAEGGDADNPANRDYVKGKGFKTLDDLVKSYREAEKAVRASGKIVVPGDGAKPEEIAAFHKAIGVPDKAEDYAVDAPEGVELDGDLVTPLREVALKAGVPAKGFKALAEGLVAIQLDQLEAMKTAEDGSAATLLKEWGAEKDAKLAAVNNAMRALDLKPADVAAMQRGFSLQGEPGSAKVLKLLARLGDGMAEDALLGGGGQKRFGITGPEAQKEIDKLIVDKEFQGKIAAKDPAAVERWNRLNQAVAHHRDLEQRQAQAKA